MAFWSNVDAEIKERGIERKDLANAVGFDVSLFSKGISSNRSPSVDIAYKIAKELNVTVEYLMTRESKKSNVNENPTVSYKINHLKKHSKTIEYLDNLPEDIKNSMVHLISAYSERYMENSTASEDEIPNIKNPNLTY